MSVETILVVDDNRPISDFLCGSLLRNLGYRSIAVYDIRSAKEILSSQTFDLMLLDLQLPDGSGPELLKWAASSGIHVPAILITAHGSEQVAVEALRLGVLDYLSKPIDTDLLNAAIERALTSSRLQKEKARLNRQLQEQVNWLKTLTRVGQSLTSTLEVDEVLRRIVEAGVHLTRADEGFLALVDKQSGQLVLRAEKNLDEDYAKTMRIPLNDSVLGSVVNTGKPLRNSQSDGKQPLKVTTGFLVYSLIHVPILLKGKALGVLSVDNRNTLRPFSDVDEAKLISLADYAAVAIDNASLYETARMEITERQRVEQALRESEERYALAVRGANDGIWDWNVKANKVYYSPRWKSMLGYSGDEIGESPNEWLTRIHIDDRDLTQREIMKHLRRVSEHFQVEHRMLHKNGEYRWMHSRAIAVWDVNGNPIRLVGSLTDINDRKYAEQKLSHDAFHDTLTDLPNRILFSDRLSLAIERAKRRENYLCAVLFLDLDRFKDINDSLGHMIGDQLLVAIARMLIAELRTTDTVARLGGDEFVILLEDIADTEDVTLVARRILNKFTTPFNLLNHEIFINASIGIVLNIAGYNRPEDVLRDADIAMYRAKANGRARFEIFDSTMRDRLLERLSLESDLRLAFEHNELTVVYQPIVSIPGRRIIGFEALVRWNHPERGLLVPNDFIPMAEETGMILPLGRWVLREAAWQAKAWYSMFPCEPPLTMSVNISGKQLAQMNFYEQVEQVIRETNLDPRCLKLEITESAIMDNMDFAVKTFSRLRELGVQIQVDDFGVGYSSLSYLSHFPIDALKIDRSFVHMMTKDPMYAKIVQTIIMLAKGLELGVIAEGVEIEDEWEQIQNMGCELAQGYYISRPDGKDVLEDMLARAYAGTANLPKQKILVNKL